MEAAADGVPPMFRRSGAAVPVGEVPATGRTALGIREGDTELFIPDIADERYIPESDGYIRNRKTGKLKPGQEDAAPLNPSYERLVAKLDHKLAEHPDYRFVELVAGRTSQNIKDFIDYNRLLNKEQLMYERKKQDEAMKLQLSKTIDEKLKRRESYDKVLQRERERDLVLRTRVIQPLEDLLVKRGLALWLRIAGEGPDVMHGLLFPFYMRWQYRLLQRLLNNSVPIAQMKPIIKAIRKLDAQIFVADGTMRALDTDLKAALKGTNSHDMVRKLKRYFAYRDGNERHLLGAPPGAAAVTLREWLRACVTYYVNQALLALPGYLGPQVQWGDPRFRVAVDMFLRGVHLTYDQQFQQLAGAVTPQMVRLSRATLFMSFLSEDNWFNNNALFGAIGALAEDVPSLFEYDEACRLLTRLAAPALANALVELTPLGNDAVFSLPARFPRLVANIDPTAAAAAADPMTEDSLYRTYRISRPFLNREKALIGDYVHYVRFNRNALEYWVRGVVYKADDIVGLAPPAASQDEINAANWILDRYAAANRLPGRYDQQEWNNQMGVLHNRFAEPPAQPRTGREGTNPLLIPAWLLPTLLGGLTGGDDEPWQLWVRDRPFLVHDTPSPSPPGAPLDWTIAASDPVFGAVRTDLQGAGVPPTVVDIAALFGGPEAAPLLELFRVTSDAAGRTPPAALKRMQIEGDGGSGLTSLITLPLFLRHLYLAATGEATIKRRKTIDEYAQLIAQLDEEVKSAQQRQTDAEKKLADSGNPLSDRFHMIQDMFVPDPRWRARPAISGRLPYTPFFTSALQTLMKAVRELGFKEVTLEEITDTVHNADLAVAAAAFIASLAYKINIEFPNRYKTKRDSDIQPRVTVDAYAELRKALEEYVKGGGRERGTRLQRLGGTLAKLPVLF